MVSIQQKYILNCYYKIMTQSLKKDSSSDPESQLKEYKMHFSKE